MTSATLPSRVVPAPNPWHAWRGVWCLTWRRFLTRQSFLLLVGLCAVLSLLGWAGHRGTSGSDYYRWWIDFYLLFILPIMGFLSGSAAIRDEMKSASADYILTRPIPRPALVIFKFAAHLACVQLQYLVVFVCLTVVGAARQAPDLVSTVPLLWLGQALTLTAFVALGFLFGALTNRYLILGLTYAGVIEKGVGNTPTQLNRIAMLHYVRDVVQPALDRADGAVTSGAGGAGAVAIVLAVSAVLVALSAALFSWREIAESPARDA